MAKSFRKAMWESTCQKRTTICEIYDATGKLLSRESNRCDPSGGMCHRLNVVQNKNNYDKESHCNWTHAEVNAVNKLKPGSKPYKAILYGHTFYCNHCEESLRKAGCTVLEISNLNLNSINMTKQNRGFAAMPKEQVSQIASMGGSAVSKNRAHMAEIGRKGGIASGLARKKAIEKVVDSLVDEQLRGDS